MEAGGTLEGLSEAPATLAQTEEQQASDSSEERARRGHNMMAFGEEGRARGRGGPRRRKKVQEGGEMIRATLCDLDEALPWFCRKVR